jgi:flavin reductase (DIM6/NTAB) family NADH-FMN oxidoreductase RutF
MRTYLIISGTRDRYNVMTADWVTMISKNPFIIGVAISPKRYTYNLINRYKEFVVAVPTVELLRDVWIAWNESGPDKIHKLNVNFIPSKIVGPPSIEECVANLECKVIDQKTYGDHTFFIGRVVAYTFDKDIFRGDIPSLSHKYVLHVGRSLFTINSEEIYNAKSMGT